jgi:hypothetical protein
MDKQLPTNFGSMPGQSPHKYFHNLCREFKKILEVNKNPKELEMEMIKFINASKEMKWKEDKHHQFKKPLGSKAVDRFYGELRRYLLQLAKPTSMDPALQDVLDALEEVIQLVESEFVE